MAGPNLFLLNLCNLHTQPLLTHDLPTTRFPDMSDSTPLLADVEGVDSQGSSLKTADATSQTGKPAFKFDARTVLILASLVVVEVIWTLFIVMMAAASCPNILMILSVILSVPTALFLGLLLYAGRRHPIATQLNQGPFSLSLRRNIDQIYVLVFFGSFWLVLAIVMSIFWVPFSVPLFAIVALLYGAAFATYKRAIKLHGRDVEVVKIVHVTVSKWKIADVGGYEEGMIQI
ncbi:unnamed protein product [Mycena citricolor]|uniref:Transmembrane protein n=2 Tax=Mycena citricolor TaxID=2018698 RepID=A0AAD2Q0H3_9AGAR|nr:unnamed protein product [Mycena citricolor]